MRRLLLITAMLTVVFAGCSTPRTEMEIRRETFRLSRVPKTQKSAFRKANSLIASGDHYYSRAKRMPELRSRENLLHTSASYYRRAILVLREMRAQMQDPTDRGYVDHVIEHANHSLQEAVRSLPMFDE